jgi:hypothetical protein
MCSGATVDSFGVTLQRLPDSNVCKTRGHIDRTKFPGGHRRGVTPVPIPNTEVKLSTADGTAWVTVWESRSLPGLFL